MYEGLSINDGMGAEGAESISCGGVELNGDMQFSFEAPAYSGEPTVTVETSSEAMGYEWLLSGEELHQFFLTLRCIIYRAVQILARTAKAIESTLLDVFIGTLLMQKTVCLRL